MAQIEAEKERLLEKIRASRQRLEALDASDMPQAKLAAALATSSTGLSAGGAATAALENDDDASSRLRMALPLVPLCVFPLISAKEGADRNATILTSTQPPGSLQYSVAGWSPSIDSPAYDTLTREFPRALPAQAVFQRSRLFLTQTFNMTPANTILGTSICPDEINNGKGGFADLANKYWGEYFPMGGLGGLPLVGKTGWGAFSHHCPEDGNIYVMYGPHVGISETGEVGKFNRVGQADPSSACGAFVGAYKQTQNFSGEREKLDGSDMEQQFIRNELGPFTKGIKETENPMATLAYKAFDIVDKQMLSILDMDFGPGKLVLLGGIQVNTPVGTPDHFQPMRFEVRQLGKPTKDVLYKCFLPGMSTEMAMKDIMDPK
jgi:hypothetical protein